MKHTDHHNHGNEGAGRHNAARRSVKHEIITFKADGSLVEAMRGIANRSDFIRAAVLAALDSSCPLCRGTGILTPNQKQHWDAFATNHAVRECADCSEPYLTCSTSRTPVTHSHS